ncbi:MAG: 6,7-dimethyl-8-ribityllumazine synthase, partial [Flavobacteriales bacterium]
MASTDLSAFPKDATPNGGSFKIAIVVARWNDHITSNLLKGCIDVLTQSQVKEENIYVEYVPGSFELPIVAQWMIQKHQPNAVICLGCIIKGETYHFELVGEACAQGIMQLCLQSNVPVIMGVLADYNEQQSLERSGGGKGNKGVEAAYTALRMAAMAENYKLN